MASSAAAHSSFPSRPYASNLGKLPDRSAGFGASGGHANREAQRLERERAEREREGGNQLGELTEEQREEINEAVSLYPSRLSWPATDAAFPVRPL